MGEAMTTTAATAAHFDAHHWVNTNVPGLLTRWVIQCSLCGVYNVQEMNAALTAAGYGLVADAKREAWAELVASSPRLPNAVRNVVFESVFDVVDKFNFPAQNMSNLPDVVEIGDVCGDIEKRIVAIIRAAEMRKP